MKPARSTALQSAAPEGREDIGDPGGAGRQRRGQAETTTPGQFGMWIFLASDAMGFGGLLLAYAMLRVRASDWPDPATRFDRPLAAVLTFVLLFSGATMAAAVGMARAGRWQGARLLAWTTVIAGLAFVAGQAMEFQGLATGRQVGLATDHAAGLFYVITGYHGLHVLVGAMVLGTVATRGLPEQAETPHPANTDSGGPQKELTSSVSALRPGPAAAPLGASATGKYVNTSTLEIVSLYWQFVDLVWIVIFTVLYLLPPAARG